MKMASEGVLFRLCKLFVALWGVCVCVCGGARVFKRQEEKKVKMILR